MMTGLLDAVGFSIKRDLSTSVKTKVTNKRQNQIDHFV